MMPQQIYLADINSERYVQEFRRGERHLVLIASRNHPFFNSYPGAAFTREEEINDMCDWVNAEGFVATFFESHGLPLTLLPQLQYQWEEGGYLLQRNDYDDYRFISRCIKQVLRLNREVVQAPRLSFVFEMSNFNIDAGIELLYHHATSVAMQNNRQLREISFMDCRLEVEE